jgi:hypothetical protein
MRWPARIVMAALAAASCTRAPHPGVDNGSAPAAGGFASLFNGRDLSGWKVPEGDNGHWKVVDGAIDYDALSEAPGDKHLWTRETFVDFILDLEWRFTRPAGVMPMAILQPDGSERTDADGKTVCVVGPNADSGVLLRGGPQVNLWCWPAGSGELWGVRTDRRNPPEVRAAAVPRRKADRPIGEWNVMRIALVGDRVTVILNGETVIENARIPGIPPAGPVGLQHHGGFLTPRQREQLKRQGAPVDDRPGAIHPASSLIQVRNVSIKRLEGRGGAGPGHGARPTG